MPEVHNRQEAYRSLLAITVVRHVLVLKQWAAEFMFRMVAELRELTLAVTFAITVGEAATD
jgi:hypothetical protein